MKAKKTALNVCLCSLIAAAAITLSACSSSATKKIEDANAFGPLNLSVMEYRQAYEDATSDEKFKSLVLLTRANIVANNLEAASAGVNELHTLAGNLVQKDETSMVQAMLLSKQNQDKAASDLLSSVNYNALPQQDIVYFLGLNSNVNSKLFDQKKDPKNLITAFKSKSAMYRYVTLDSDKRKVLTQSVDLLKQLDNTTLSNAYSNVRNDTDKGYYEYAIIDKSSSDSLKKQMLSTFAEKYPNHPLLYLTQSAQAAAKNNVITTGSYDASVPADGEPAKVNQNSIFKITDGDKIAVLLPLSGRFGKIVGEPAKLGILTALKDRGSASKVVFYDTNKNNISDIVASVSRDGTALVIGPVLKPEVNAINAAGLKLPSVTFNAADGNAPVNQWHFDLGPNYEGAVAASKIYADGFRSPLVISASSDSGAERSVQSFRETFAKVKTDASVCHYSSSASITSDLSGCPLSKADAVYVNASAVDAVTIKPLIPNSAAVYLTDKSYLGVNNTAQEMALSGAMLGDMPWLVTDSQLKESFMKSMPRANTQVQRIFAAAYDAVNFAFNIDRLAANSNDVLHGLSGDISLGEKNLIESAPLWVKLGNFRK